MSSSLPDDSASPSSLNFLPWTPVSCWGTQPCLLRSVLGGIVKDIQEPRSLKSSSDPEAKGEQVRGSSSSLAAARGPGKELYAERS